MVGKYKPYPEYKDSEIEWLGDVPAHWKVCRVKNAATVNPSKSEVRGLPADSQVSFIPMEAIGEKGELDASRIKTLPEVLTGYTYVADGDIMIAKITPCFENGKGAIAKNLINGIGFATTEVIPIRPKRPADANFLFYVLNCNPFKFIAESSMYGAGGQKRVADSFVAEYHLSIPSESERVKIANFLDHETTQIDTLIEKQQQLIQLLKEKRQAVIDHAVTKGLNPKVKMRDSGIEWLGEVPEGWVVVNVRNLIRAGVLETQDGNHGELHPVAAEYVNDGIPFLMANNVQNGAVSLRDSKYISLERAEKLRIGFSLPNDLLLTHKGTVGEVALVPESIDVPYWMLTPQVTYYRWKNNKYLSRFFYMFFRSSCFQVQLGIIGGKQSTRAYVGLIAQGDLILAVPPVDEQYEIFSFLESAVSEYEYLISKAESAISFSQERRTALISAAVTGKIDVRTWVAPQASQIDKEVAA